MSQEQELPCAWSPRDDALLRSVIERLAVIPRLPTSDGERRAAHIICDDLLQFGCQANVEDVPAYGSYAWPIGLMCATSVAAGWAAGRGHRLLGAIGAGLGAAGIADDISGGRMALRRLFLRSRRAHNVIGLTGDITATQTLVVLAHHDAAPSGFVFHQHAQQWLARNRPDLVEAMASTRRCGGSSSLDPRWSRSPAPPAATGPAAQAWSSAWARWPPWSISACGPPFLAPTTTLRASRC